MTSRVILADFPVCSSDHGHKKCPRQVEADPRNNSAVQ
jgi:hypothetical protein